MLYTPYGEPALESPVDPDLLAALRDESERIEEDCLYSSRGHFEAAASWSRAHYRIGVPAAILAAVAGGSALADNVTIAAGVGLLVTALSALAVFLNPSDRSHQHHAAGTRFNEVRNKARVFREIDLRTGPEPTRLAEDLKGLGMARDELNKASPQIPRWAFERARRSIEAGEAAYRVDSGRVTGNAS